MPIPSVDLSIVHRTLDRIDTIFGFTLNWTEPFDNFDPIHNYTIIIGCDGSGCPVTLTADGNATSIDVSYATRTTNITIMITAMNSVGTSHPASLDATGKLEDNYYVHSDS